MGKKVKLLQAQHASELDKKINYYLENGWRLKGDMVSHNFNLVVTIYKK